MLLEPLTDEEYKALMEQLHEMVYSSEHTKLFSSIADHKCFHYYNFSQYPNSRRIPVKAYHAIKNIAYQFDNLTALCKRTGLNYEEIRLLIKTNGPYLVDGWQILPGRSPDAFCRLYHPKIPAAKVNPW